MTKLLNHIGVMQNMASVFISPAPYVDRNGTTAVNEADRCGLFSADMIYMLDGPEQREAEVMAPGDGLNMAWAITQRLHRLFDTPAPYVPTMQDPELVRRRIEWIESETDELRAAETLVDQADAYLDVIVFALGGLVELGVQPGQLYNIVMASQFAKVWPDGKPHVREDGKWLKPPGWVAPEAECQAEIQHQVEAADTGCPPHCCCECDNCCDCGQPKNLVPPS